MKIIIPKGPDSRPEQVALQMFALRFSVMLMISLLYSHLFGVVIPKKD